MKNRPKKAQKDKKKNYFLKRRLRVKKIFKKRSKTDPKRQVKKLKDNFEMEKKKDCCIWSWKISLRSWKSQ